MLTQERELEIATDVDNRIRAVFRSIGCDYKDKEEGSFALRLVVPLFCSSIEDIAPHLPQAVREEQAKRLYQAADKLVAFEAQ